MSIRFGDEEGPGDWTPPAADSFDVVFCDHCENAHILLKDKNEKPIAQMSMNLENLQLIINMIMERKGERPPMRNEALPKLLRAIAKGEQAKENRHDTILNAAADELEMWRKRRSS